MKTIFQRKGFKITFFLIIFAILAFIGNDSKAFTCGTDTVSYGGKNYATVQIGTQCWFRENLNVGTMLASAATMPDDTAPTLNNPDTVQKWCYNNDSAICNTDGGLYTWAEANALANSCNTTTCTPSEPNQGICPTGWHIPSDAEQYTLENYLKDSGQTCNAARVNVWDCSSAGSKLSTLVLNGNNSSGFTALIAGARSSAGSFAWRGSSEYFWSSWSGSASHTWVRYLNPDYAKVCRSAIPKTYGVSVRCFKNSTTTPTITTGSASSITSTTATLSANLTDTGGENPTRYIQWGTSTGSYTSSCDQSTGTNGTYSCNLTSLTPNITYYFRAYATNSGGTTYGEEQSFTTPISLSGVTSGETYFSQVTPVFSGTALLNGNSFTSGTSITQNGSYTLYIVGSTNTITATFTLIISKTITNPTPAIINNDVTSGIITVSGTSTEATNATIKTNYTLQSGNSLLSIPKDTIITPATGTVDITALNVSDISNTISQQNSNSKGAIKIGIPNKNVNFSQDVTVAMSVGSSYNDKTLTIYSRPDSGGDWTYETTCNVSGGECTFTTDHATEYTGNYEVSNSPTPTDTNLDINATISISCDETVTMATITGTGFSGSITGPGATNEADCNIKTINSSGYQLAWQASTAYMQNENGDQINAYTPVTSDTPEVWSVEASMSEWGARIKSSSTDPDRTAGAIWGITGDTYAGRFLNVGTSSFTVANRSTETDQTGSNETILFGAEIGSNKFQPTGTYTTDVMMTATTL